MTPNSLIDILQGYLQLTADRQRLVVSNMANVDTPGYRTKDINFQSAMRQAMYEDDSVQLDPTVQTINGLPERPDGNNVNIDRESTLLSETQLQYQMGEQLLKGEFQNLLTAIKDGN
jgi:flagellar basal-body rod protein FlgB